jgi:Subtilase family
MPDSSEQFPHISLRLVQEGRAILSGGGEASARTLQNRGDAGGHGSKLKSSVDLITTNWKEEKEKRREEGKSDLPNAISFILEVDPDFFDADDLKSFGIEVVADLEQGYIIGASSDTELSELRKKIEKLIQENKGKTKLPAIWEILEGTKRPEYILSDLLKAEWDQIQENQEYVVDVGISCIDVKEQYSRCPKRDRYKSDESFQKGINRWLDKYNLSPEELDDLYWTREQQLESFIKSDPYNGEILSSIPFSDSFSCRIRIPGEGLKDLVLNFPYIFDVSEPDEFSSPSATPNESESNRETFILEPPDANAPRVCVIDSGIQELHPKLRVAIDSSHSKSWVPGELDKTADYVRGGGHGTRVAGAILYPRGIPQTGHQKAICWLQNARILGDASQGDKLLPKKLFPPAVLQEIVELYYRQTRTRIFNHSVAGISPCRTQSMTPWAAEIDKLTWEKEGNILFIVAAGNIEARASFVTRPSIAAHFQSGRNYPDYLLTPSARIANPAQSFQALTVGSVAHITYESLPLRSIAEVDCPSAFSCTGLGIWDTIKPEVVEYGGDYVVDSPSSPSFSTPEVVCPELVRSTLYGGKIVSSDAVGTSFATPKVTHIAAALAATFPQESALLYRALIIQSARLPNWVDESPGTLYQTMRTMGYGIPNIDRALGNAANRITLKVDETEYISARQAKVYQVQIPENFLTQGEGFDVLVEITLSYVAEPRRTRRHRRKYLSTWLDWTCSKRGEDPQAFLYRVLKMPYFHTLLIRVWLLLIEINIEFAILFLCLLHDSLKNQKLLEESEEGEGLFRWTLGKKRFKPDDDGQKRPTGIDGIVKELSRSNGTIQKDWAIVESYDLREGFCIAVVGHEGWNKDPQATVPYALVVSFEAINSEISIYDAFVQVQQPLQAQQEVKITAS